jgi:hypothetical protein
MMGQGVFGKLDTKNGFLMMIDDKSVYLGKDLKRKGDTHESGLIFYVVREASGVENRLYFQLRDIYFQLLLFYFQLCITYFQLLIYQQFIP